MGIVHTVKEGESLYSIALRYGFTADRFRKMHGLAEGTVLQPGMMFTIEPGVYIEGVGGVRIEDDVVITADGCESLTSFERDLISL